MDAADYELQKEPQAPPPPRSRGPSPVPVIVGAIAIVAVVAGFFYMRRDTAGPASSSGAIATDTAIPPTPPLGVEVPPIELPPLEASDDLVRMLVRGLSSHPRVAAWLTTNGLIRNVTVVVDNIAAGQTPARHLRVLKPNGPFTIIDVPGGDALIDPRSYARYNDVAAAVASVNPAGAAKLYSTLKPRIEEAYEEIGAGRPFDRTLETAIVQLLETPPVEGEIALVPRGALYTFSDLRIERLTQAQKQLARMGARNVRVIQGRLRDIARELGIPPERLPPR